MVNNILSVSYTFTHKIGVKSYVHRKNRESGERGRDGGGRRSCKRQACAYMLEMALKSCIHARRHAIRP